MGVSRTIILAMILAVLYGCKPYSVPTEPNITMKGVLPDLGERIEDCSKISAARGVISGSFTQARVIKWQQSGILYRIGVDENCSVVYVSTMSASFRTPEGLSTSASLSDLMKRFPKGTLVHERRFGYFLELPSGWNAGFTEFDKTQGVFVKPQLSSPIRCFMKREPKPHGVKYPLSGLYNNSATPSHR